MVMVLGKLVFVGEKKFFYMEKTKKEISYEKAEKKRAGGWLT